MSTNPATSVARRRARLMSNTEMQERAAHARAAQLPSVPSVPRVDVIAMRPRLMSKPAVLEAVGLSYSTVWSLMRANKFPRSVVIAGKSAWHAHEVEAWIRALPRSRLKGDAPAEQSERLAVPVLGMPLYDAEFAAMVADDAEFAAMVALVRDASSRCFAIT